MQVDQWLDYSSEVVTGAGLTSVVQYINSYLSLRTFLAGYSMSLADVQVWGQLQGKQTSWGMTMGVKCSCR